MYLLWLVADQFKDRLNIGERGALAFKIATLLMLTIMIKNDGTIDPVGLWIFRGLAGVLMAYFTYAFIKVRKEDETEEEVSVSENKVYKFFHNKIGVFWSTVILVEIMDLAFSIDNVFAAVAFSKNLILISIGVGIGILAMRFVAQAFVQLMEKFKFLETAAFIVIAILGVKLVLSLCEHFYPESAVSIFLGSHLADIATSIITVTIFLVPIATSMLFNFPKKKAGA